MFLKYFTCICSQINIHTALTNEIINYNIKYQQNYYYMVILLLANRDYYGQAGYILLYLICCFIDVLKLLCIPLLFRVRVNIYTVDKLFLYLAIIFNIHHHTVFFIYNIY